MNLRAHLVTLIEESQQKKRGMRAGLGTPVVDPSGGHGTDGRGAQGPTLEEVSSAVWRVRHCVHQCGKNGTVYTNAARMVRHTPMRGGLQDVHKCGKHWTVQMSDKVGGLLGF